MKYLLFLLLIPVANLLPAQQPTGIILGMVLLEDPEGFRPEALVADLRGSWGLEVVYEPDDATTSMAVSIDGYTIALMPMPVAVPEQEIRETAEYNYLWTNGADEALRHRGHVIVSLLGGGKNPVAENLLFSKVVSAVLNTSPSALGVYLGGRTLLLKKAFYLSNMEGASLQDLPLYNWIYFGMRQEHDKHSAYTYGLADFGKKEMEIVRSKRDLLELQELMYNLAHYVLAYDVTLNPGETIGMSATQKLKITESEGVFLEGKTLKIGY